MSEVVQVGGLKLEFLQTKDNTDSSLDMFKMTVQRNARMPVPHYHESWDESAYGLTGKTNFRLGDQDLTLEPGQSVFIKRGVVHSFSNDTQSESSCLCVLTPGALGSAYFRDIAALMSGGAPDLAKMKETMLRYGLVPVPQG
jgi:quercetin dioxygenase-like cupin family protein